MFSWGVSDQVLCPQKWLFNSFFNALGVENVTAQTRFWLETSHTSQIRLGIPPLPCLNLPFSLIMHDWSIALRTKTITNSTYSAQKLRKRRLILDDRPNLDGIWGRMIKRMQEIEGKVIEKHEISIQQTLKSEVKVIKKWVKKWLWTSNLAKRHQKSLKFSITQTLKVIKSH